MKLNATRFCHLFIWSVVSSGSGAVAQEGHSHKDILHAATTFVSERAAQFTVAPVVEPGRLDSRLRLPRCPQPLEAFEPPNGLKAGRIVVGVRCASGKPWKLFVPVKVSLPGRVVVAARHLRRGATVGADDVALKERDLATLHRDYFEDVARVIGLKLRRNLTRNAILSPNALEVEQLVRRGSEVTILAADPRVRVSVKGKALGNGTSGERIKVENLSSGRKMSATVIGRGLVRVRH